MEEHKIRISAKGFFFNSKDELILIIAQKVVHGKRSFYSAPGGGVEEDENLRSAVERELKEETGYSGVAESVVFVQDFLNLGGRRQLEVFFSGKIDESKVPLDHHDHDFKFFSEAEFTEISFLPKIDPFVLRRKEQADYQTYLKPKAPVS